MSADPPERRPPRPRALPVTRLAHGDAGELVTLQRAAYVTEARAHGDLDLPPLTETLDDVVHAFADPDVIVLGVRDAGRLVGAVRLHRRGDVVEVGRLTVVPDRQGQGIGSLLLRAAETALPDTSELRLFTGEHSLANIALYERRGYVETHRSPAGGYQLVHFVKSLR